VAGSPEEKTIEMNDEEIEEQQAAFEAIEAGVLKLYALERRREERDPPREAEHVRREQALMVIDETLDFSPLSAYSATHLELLQLLLCYWRQCEDQGEVHAPGPERMQ
jgi:hypothetical protein